jgi:hypothetical protein
MLIHFAANGKLFTRFNLQNPFGRKSAPLPLINAFVRSSTWSSRKMPWDSKQDCMKKCNQIIFYIFRYMCRFLSSPLTYKNLFFVMHKGFFFPCPTFEQVSVSSNLILSKCFEQQEENKYYVSCQFIDCRHRSLIPSNKSCYSLAHTMGSVGRRWLWENQHSSFGIL